MASTGPKMLGVGRCGMCNTIIFGGVKSDGKRFCNRRCRDRYRAHRAANVIPRAELDDLMLRVFDGRCPKCGGPGPVDVTLVHDTFSLFWFSWATKKAIVACRSCGRRSQGFALLRCSVLGWWSVMGIVLTPIALARNLWGLRIAFDEELPSKSLEELLHDDAKVRQELERHLERQLSMPHEDLGPPWN